MRRRNQQHRGGEGEAPQEEGAAQADPLDDASGAPGAQKSADGSGPQYPAEQARTQLQGGGGVQHEQGGDHEGEQVDRGRGS